MTIRKAILTALFSFSLLLLGACASEGMSKTYQQSRLAPELRVPSDLDRPDSGKTSSIEPLPESEVKSLDPDKLLLPPRLAGVAETDASPTTKPSAAHSELKEDANGVVFLDIASRYDEAWRNARLALMSSGFTLTDMNRSAGLFYIRYRDPEGAEDQREEYTLHLLEVGSRSRLVVRDTDGQMLGGETARRILKFIADNL